MKYSENSMYPFDYPSSCGQCAVHSSAAGSGSAACIPPGQMLVCRLVCRGQPGVNPLDAKQAGVHYLRDGITVPKMGYCWSSKTERMGKCFVISEFPVWLGVEVLFN